LSIFISSINTTSFELFLAIYKAFSIGPHGAGIPSKV